MLAIKSYKPEKTCPVLKKGETATISSNLNENNTIGFSISEILTVEVSSSVYKNVKFCIFCQKQDCGCVFIYLLFTFLFFYQGW